MSRFYYLLLLLIFSCISVTATVPSIARSATSVKAVLPFISQLSTSPSSLLLMQKSSPSPFQMLKCQNVHSYFEEQGFSSSDIPSEPISSNKLKFCEGSTSGGEVCCSANMESQMQAMARNKHDKATRDTLQQLQTILHTRAVRFHDFFNNLLKTSKKNFHDMFKKTYGILYEQNAYVFIDLFKELEKYYAKGLVDLDDIMDTFFNTLYQKMFTVLNSQYKFDNKYLECVGHHMKEMRPFGDVPQKLGVQIKRSFIATRAFSQALTIAADVLKNMQQLKASNECVVALTKMTVCPTCSGISRNVLACNKLCENVMEGCLAHHIALDADWNHFVEAVDKVADRLLGPFNIEMLVRPINLKISEAIMNFQESSSDVSQRVFTGCGRPVLGRRRRRSRAYEYEENDNQKSFRFEDKSEHNLKKRDKKRKNDNEEEVDDNISSAVILDKLVKEIKQRIRDSRQFWLYLPYKLCNDGLVVPPSNTNNCWNGTHVDKYVYPVLTVTSFQNISTEVKEQIYSLVSISNRLRSAFNGHDVDWIDTEESWSSGSGSGSGTLDSVTDDEDGFNEEGSGVYTETTTKEVADITVKIQVHENSSSFSSSTLSPVLGQLPTRVEIIERVSQENTPEIDVDLNHVNTTQHFKGKSKASTSRQMSLSKALTTYLLPIVVVWFGFSLTECL